MPTHACLTLGAALSWVSYPSSNQLSASLLQGACRSQRRDHPKDGLCSSVGHMAHAQPLAPISAQCGSSCLLPHGPACQHGHQSRYGNSSKCQTSVGFSSSLASGMHSYSFSPGFTSHLGSGDQSSFEELGRRPSKAVSWGCSLGPGVFFEGKAV